MVETMKIKTNALRTNLILKVILPDDGYIRSLMILLHGNLEPESSRELFDAFPLKLGLEELCGRYHMMAVIPFMKNRYYISTEEYNCDEFIAHELPDYIKAEYAIENSADMILAGVSMGGFGASLIAARTGVFQKIISVSGAYITDDIEIGNPEVWGKLTPSCAELKSSFLYYFLPLTDLADSVNRNALAALKLFRERNERPEFVVTCGTEDWLYSRNAEFIKALEKYDINYRFYPIPDDSHDSECFRKGLWKAVECLSDHTFWAGKNR